MMPQCRVEPLRYSLTQVQVNKIQSKGSVVYPIPAITALLNYAFFY